MKLSTKIYDENQIAFMTFDNILYQPAERIFIVPDKKTNLYKIYSIHDEITENEIIRNIYIGPVTFD